MSEARDLFLALQRQGKMFMPGQQEVHKVLIHAAELWRRDGRHFSAGYAMSRAVHSAWGDPEQMAADQKVAVVDFQTAANTDPPESLETCSVPQFDEALWEA